MQQQQPPVESPPAAPQAEPCLFDNATPLDYEPSWPVGIRLSKREPANCYVPEDLCVLLTREAFEQLFGYAYATSDEISCLGAVKREGGIFVVERFHLVKQQGGAAHTEMEPEAVGQLIEELLAKGQADEARSLKCWAHSHPRMDVFWSKTDDDTCQRLASDYLVSLVVSDGFAIRCRIDTRAPFPFTVDQVPVLCESKADEATLARYAEEVRKKLSHASFLPALEGGGKDDLFQGPDGEVLCPDCRHRHPPGKCPRGERHRSRQDEFDDWRNWEADFEILSERGLGRDPDTW
jgi:hypothetical protein